MYPKPFILGADKRAINSQERGNYFLALGYLFRGYSCPQVQGLGECARYRCLLTALTAVAGLAEHL